jgi:hypothetical protein
MGHAGPKVLKDEDALGDRVSVGLLARAFPRATVEAVIQASGAREQRGHGCCRRGWLCPYVPRVPDIAMALLSPAGG